MTCTRLYRLTCAVLVIAAAAANPAPAAFISTLQPTAAYKASTLLFPVNVPDFNVVSSVSNGLTINFDRPLVALTTPTTWASWGAPPNTESATPRVLWTNGFTSLTLSTSIPVTTLGFEAEPNTAVVSTLTATFFNNNTQVGEIIRDVGGALLFAGTNDTPFNKVVVTSLDDFAIAQLRANAVPEPASVVQLAGASVIGLTVWLIRRAWRQASIGDPLRTACSTPSSHVQCVWRSATRPGPRPRRG
jgi:hypothetical protein